MLSSECTRCHKTIHLVVAPSGDSGKWVTSTQHPETWHCGNDPEFPVLAHQPRTIAAP